MKRPSLTVATAMVAGGPVPNLPPPVQGVWHDLHLQGASDPLPRAIQALQERPDVRVFLSDGRGAAASRNAALVAAQGDVLLFCDDDIVQNPDAHAALLEGFAQDLNLDFVCARLIGPDGRPHKAYGPDGQPVRFWNAARIGTPELALRMATIRALGLRFDEQFGAGTSTPLGDEFIFVMDCLRAGLKGRHINLVMGEHPSVSSGLNFAPQTLPWRRAVFRRALGWYWWPAYMAFLWRNRFRARRSAQ